jgi:hypothetical protein
LKRSNFVASTTDPSLTITGIWIFNQSGNNGLAKVLHNSIFLTSDTDVTYSSGGINLSGGSTGNFPADVYNNIVVNNIGTSSASYRSFALVDGNTTRGSLRSNNNVLFANGTNGFLGAIGRELGGAEQFSNTLSLFQTFSLTNGESVSFLPAFANTAAGDLSILASAANPANYLVPILANVPADIGGTIRFTPLTFAGAYEGVESLSSADVRKLDLKIFPNPALNQLNIANSNGGTLNSVKIYSVLGAEVISLNLNSSNFQSEYQINVSALNAGMYIIQIQGSEGSTTRKFVKN